MMNRPQPAQWRVILHTYPCATCGAGPGASCRSPSGKPQHLPHVDRYRQAHERGWLAADIDEDEPTQPANVFPPEWP